MSVGGIMEAYQKPYEIYDFDTLKRRSPDRSGHHRPEGLSDERVQVLLSPVKGAGMMLEGADKAACDKLVALLDEKHII